MGDRDRQKWDDRYAEDRYVYGAEPSSFLEDERARLPTSGRALDIAAGEGRNAVFLASLGLQTDAIDISAVGLRKAERLASERGVEIQVILRDLTRSPLPDGPYDLIICMHYKQPDLAEPISERLAPGGLLLMELPTLKNLELHKHPSKRYLVESNELNRLVSHAVHPLLPRGHLRGPGGGSPDRTGARTMSDAIKAARTLSRAVDKLQFGPPVTHVYNPLSYAAENHAAYLQRFARPPKQVVLLGMNPGPWGMAQTGVPFGDAKLVRDWLGIDGAVDKPRNEHPKRPVVGVDCARSEVSGSRLWGAIREHFGEPGRFFDRFFIANYCPLSFMEDGGRNRTPDKLPAAEREPLFALCDEHLRQLVRYLRAPLVIGIGAFAEARARAALVDEENVSFGRILHPSPASPAANRDWVGQVKAQLTELGICR